MKNESTVTQGIRRARGACGISSGETVKRSNHICIEWWYGAWIGGVEGSAGTGRPENMQASVK